MIPAVARSAAADAGARGGLVVQIRYTPARLAVPPGTVRRSPPGPIGVR